MTEKTVVYVKPDLPTNSNRYVAYKAMREFLPPAEFEDPATWMEVTGTLDPSQYIDKELKILVPYPANSNIDAVFDYDKQEWVSPAKSLEDQWSDLRRKRDQLMAASDWVVVRAQETGTPVPSAWLVYRQTLRDITEQPGAPMNVLWPTKPAS